MKKIIFIRKKIIIIIIYSKKNINIKTKLYLSERKLLLNHIFYKNVFNNI